MVRTALFLLFVLFVSNQGRTVRRLPLIRDNRIVNGVPAQEGEYPSQLSLLAYGSHNCGASVLNEQYALTAAHCVDGWFPEDLTLLAGTIDLNNGGSLHEVQQIIAHQDYNPYDSWRNDIAVLKVKTPFPIGGNVQPITLPQQSPSEGSTATVIGWGRLQEGGALPSILQKVDIAIVSQETCYDIYQTIGYPIYSGHICAGLDDKGSCNGDSGGPLFVDGAVVGLVSWANGCANPDYPTVYTRVNEFKGWIKEQTGV